MGAYLSEPVTDKEASEGSNKWFDYGVAAMQGWRVTMEDAHAVQLQLNDEERSAFFGVFDGHGGKEVAKFCALSMAHELVGTEAFKAGRTDEALVAVYLRMDEMLSMPSSRDELKRLRTESVPSTAKSRDSHKAHSTPRCTGGSSGCSSGSAATTAAAAQCDASVCDHQLAPQAAPMSVDLAPAKLSVDVSAFAAAEGGDVDGDSEASTPTRIQHTLDPLNVVREWGDDMGSPESAREWIGPSAGCTAVVAVVRDGCLFVANAGDSRCVLSRGGKAEALTRDHKPTDPEEEKRITAAGGFVADGRVNGSLNLSRALGDMEYKQSRDLAAGEQVISAVPDIRSVKLTQQDEFLILACDGIWDVLTNQQAVDFARERLQRGVTPKQICMELCDHCLAADTDGIGKGCDNMSAMVVQLRGIPP